MANTYTLSIVKNGGNLSIWGDAKTGVIQRVAWRMDGTDGVNTTAQSGIAVLPAIDPTSPTFVPLNQITEPVLLQWANQLIDLPKEKATIDANLTALTQEAAQPATPQLAQLQLNPVTAAQAAAGVPV